MVLVDSRYALGFIIGHVDTLKWVGFHQKVMLFLLVYYFDFTSLFSSLETEWTCILVCNLYVSFGKHFKFRMNCFMVSIRLIV